MMKPSAMNSLSRQSCADRADLWRVRAGPRARVSSHTSHTSRVPRIQ